MNQPSRLCGYITTATIISTIPAAIASRAFALMSSISVSGQGRFRRRISRTVRMSSNTAAMPISSSGLGQHRL